MFLQVSLLLGLSVVDRAEYRVDRVGISSCEDLLDVNGIMIMTKVIESHGFGAACGGALPSTISVSRL